MIAGQIGPCKYLLTDVMVARGFIFVDFVIRDVALVELIFILRSADPKLIRAGTPIQRVLSVVTAVAWLKLCHAHVCEQAGWQRLLKMPRW